MALPTPKLEVGLAGLQLIVAPAGNPLGTQLALLARLGPLFVQVTVPVTVLPAGALAGNPLTVATMSACSTMDKGLVSALLLLLGSAVVLPAVVVMLSGPLAGVVKVEVQVMLLPTAKALGSGLGVQLCVAPTGKPLKAQLGAAAGLGPLLVHVPLTVTGCPALALAGTVVAATMSACGTTLVAACALLLPGVGSAVLDPAVPVMVMPPVAGTV
jgi:hypothetical protein